MRNLKHQCQLWFDVEKKYKTISIDIKGSRATLWFDVEKKYKTINAKIIRVLGSCGLM